MDIQIYQDFARQMVTKYGQAAIAAPALHYTTPATQQAPHQPQEVRSLPMSFCEPRS